MQCHGGVDGTKSDRGVVYRFLITIFGKHFVYKLIIELANKLRGSTHRRYLCYFHCFVFIILRPKNLVLFNTRKFNDSVLKNHYIICDKTPINKAEST